MPSSRFIPFASKRRKGLQSVLDVASEFEVSITCAAVKYVVSNIIPCIIIKWSIDGVLDWKWISKELYEQDRIRKTIETVNELPADCPTSQLFCNPHVENEDFIERGQQPLFGSRI